MIVMLLALTVFVTAVHGADPFDPDRLDQFGREPEDLRSRIELPGPDLRLPHPDGPG